MRRVLLVLLVVALALALAASVSAACGWKCGTRVVPVFTVEGPRERGSGCAWFGPSTPVWSICPTPTP